MMNRGKQFVVSVFLIVYKDILVYQKMVKANSTVLGKEQSDQKPLNRPEVIKLFPCSTQLSMKFQLLMRTTMLLNTDFSLRCCIYHANKC